MFTSAQACVVPARTLHVCWTVSVDRFSSLAVSGELFPVSLSVKAGSRGKNVETPQKPCFIYVPIGSWIKSVVKVLVAKTSV